MVANFENMAADGDDDGDDRFAVPAVGQDAAVARADRGPLRACGGVPALDETGAEPRAALAGLAAAPLPRALVVAVQDGGDDLTRRMRNRPLPPG